MLKTNFNNRYKREKTNDNSNVVPSSEGGFFNRKIITIILILINIIFFVFEYLKIGKPILSGQENLDQLLNLGANYGESSLSGESYRILVSVFLHSSLFHLISDVIILLILGFFVEKKMGSFWYLFLYVFVGCFSNFMSALLSHKSIFVGASSSIFSIIAASFIYKMLASNETRINFYIIFILFFWDLILGFIDPHINTLTNVVGIISGIVLVSSFNFFISFFKFLKKLF